ncbi:MAG: hypothetical protein F6J96_33200 [Symploca sp. SIO1C2]|nr:hypothetical protein [Symploca sp. SIO1C2]
MSITIAQLTDTHLCCHPDAELRGCRPWHRLQAVIQRVAQVKPDYLLLTGDLADKGLPSAYQQFTGCWCCEYAHPVHVVHSCQWVTKYGIHCPPYRHHGSQQSY